MLDNSSGVPLLTLPAGEAASDYHVYVLYKEGETTKQVGRLHVRSESEVTYPVTLVPMAAGISTAGLAGELNRIYAPYAVKWQVAEDNALVGNTDWDVTGTPGQINTGDAFLSEYSDDQISLHSYYKEFGTNYDASRSYVFLFNNFPVSLEGDDNIDASTKLGDMPINRRWGYLFNVGSEDPNDLARTLAHELGHGRLTLRHTFADEICGGDPGVTPNLMDYVTDSSPLGGGQEGALNRFQWEASHNPALVGDVFQTDEDGEFAIIPLLVKAGANALVDFGIQVVCGYYFNPACANDWGKAFDEVNYWSVLKEFCLGAIPWKIPGGAIGEASLYAAGDVIIAIGEAHDNGLPYTISDVGFDFTQGLILNLICDGVGDMFAKYGPNGIRAGLRKLGFSDDFIAKFVKKGDFDKVLEEALDFEDNIADVADVGKTFWKNFEFHVSDELQKVFPNNKIGSQITLDFHILENGVPKVVTIRPDNLVQIDIGGIKKYKLIDAKTSKVNDLVNMADLTGTCTPNQKVAYKIVDGAPDAGIVLQKVEMRGKNAIEAFEFEEFIDGKLEIQIEQEVEFWVNSSIEDCTQYVTRSRVK